MAVKIELFFQSAKTERKKMFEKNIFRLKCVCISEKWIIFADKMNVQILENIRTLKRRLLPNDQLILFGSQVRGDARSDSDWDLLILLNKDGKHNWNDFDKYAYPFTEIGWDYRVTINPILYTQEEWEKGGNFPFYKNVMREGVFIH